MNMNIEYMQVESTPQSLMRLELCRSYLETCEIYTNKINLKSFSKFEFF